MDDAGKRNNKTDLTGSYDYLYDATNRFIQVTTGSTVQEQYTYDPVGNRLSSSKEQSLEADNYDETTYGYDGENRLIDVTMVKNGLYREIRFSYGPFGRRYSKTIQRDEIGALCSTLACPRTTFYLYDGPNVVAEYDEWEHVTARYVYSPGIDEPLSVEKNGQIYYYHADGLGSITALSDAQGNIVQRYEYDSFGNILSSSGNITQPYGYTGREYDSETGLYYYRARYYDPKVGRFISEDPIGFAGGDVNLYAYVSNNPINLIDPDGQLAWVLGGAAIGAGINVAAIIIANGGRVTAQQLAAAAVGGAISGAIGSLAGPLGGTVAKFLGQSATSALAGGVTAAFSAGGGYAGQVVANTIDSCHASSPLNAALFAGIGGGSASFIVKTPGMYTINQIKYFAPTTFSGINNSALVGSYATSAGLGAASIFGGPF